MELCEEIDSSWDAPDAKEPKKEVASSVTTRIVAAVSTWDVQSKWVALKCGRQCKRILAIQVWLMELLSSVMLTEEMVISSSKSKVPMESKLVERSKALSMPISLSERRLINLLTWKTARVSNQLSSHLLVKNPPSQRNQKSPELSRRRYKTLNLLKLSNPKPNWSRRWSRRKPNWPGQLILRIEFESFVQLKVRRLPREMLATKRKRSKRCNPTQISWCKTRWCRWCKWWWLKTSCRTW